MGHPLLDSAEVLRDMTGLADEMVGDITELNEALDVLGQLTDTRKLLDMVIDLVDKRCIDLRPPRQDVPVPGGGTYKVSGGSTRDVYDNDRLRGAVARAIVTQHGWEGGHVVRDTGEPEDAAAAVEGIVKTVCELTGATAPSFSNWRQRPAARLGIGLAEYRDRTTTGLRGRIEGRSLT